MRPSALGGEVTTTRADERVMRFASDYGFKINGKPYPSGHGYDLVLYLRDAAGFPEREA